MPRRALVLAIVVAAGPMSAVAIAQDPPNDGAGPVINGQPDGQPAPLPKKLTPGCKPATSAASPRVDVSDSRHQRSLPPSVANPTGHTLYSHDIFAAKANKDMVLNASLRVYMSHGSRPIYSARKSLKLEACNEIPVVGSFPTVDIRGDLPTPQKIPGAYQLLVIKQGKTTVLRQKYAVTKP